MILGAHMGHRISGRLWRQIGIRKGNLNIRMITVSRRKIHTSQIWKYFFFSRLFKDELKSFFNFIDLDPDPYLSNGADLDPLTTNADSHHCFTVLINGSLMDLRKKINLSVVKVHHFIIYHDSLHYVIINITLYSYLENP